MPPQEKDAACDIVSRMMEEIGPIQTIFVRVNPLETGMTGFDLEAITSKNLYGITLPRVQLVNDNYSGRSCCLIGKCYLDFCSFNCRSQVDITQVCLIHFTQFGRSIHQLFRQDDPPLAYPALKRSQLMSAVTAGITGHQPVKQLGSLRVRMLLERGIKVSMDGKGRYLDNISVGRLWRSVKYEEVYLKAYRDGSEEREALTLIWTFTIGSSHTSPKVIELRPGVRVG